MSATPQPTSARDLAAEVLLEEDKKRAYVRDLLSEARSKLADPRDRALLTELTYGVVRRRSTLDAVLQPRSRRPLEKLARPVRVALRLALYQVLFLDRVPVHAAVNHAVSWARGRTNTKTSGFVNAVLRASARNVEGLARGAEMPRRDVPRDDGSAMRIKEDVFADPDVDLAAALAGRYSMPRWLVARWLESAGERSTLARLRTGIGRPPLGLRARGERGDLYRALQEAGLTVRPGPVDTALLVEGGPESVALEHVARGDAWVQDATAQQVAPLVDPQPDERVLDLCAAPGGKALHLADLMQRGTIVACDVAAEKLTRLEALVDLVPDGVTLDVQQVPREGPLPLEAGSFDRILVDAPCTNTGVLRRRVEVRWRLDLEDIQALAKLQRDLLDRALVLLKPGGRLVYTTCSLESEENEETIASFLAAHPEVVREKSTEVPGGRDQDGGFAAVMRRGS